MVVSTATIHRDIFRTNEPNAAVHLSDWTAVLHGQWRGELPPQRTTRIDPARVHEEVAADYERLRAWPHPRERYGLDEAHDRLVDLASVALYRDGQFQAIMVVRPWNENRFQRRGYYAPHPDAFGVPLLPEAYRAAFPLEHFGMVLSAANEQLRAADPNPWSEDAATRSLARLARGAARLEDRIWRYVQGSFDDPLFAPPIATLTSSTVENGHLVSTTTRSIDPPYVEKTLYGVPEQALEPIGLRVPSRVG